MASMTSSATTSRVLTLAFSDWAGSTALKAQRGDAAVGKLIARHREHVADLASHCRGDIIDWAGDGCFLTFETSGAAVTFALRLQRIHHFEADLPGVPIGVHMGEARWAFRGPDSLRPSARRAAISSQTRRRQRQAPHGSTAARYHA